MQPSTPHLLLIGDMNVNSSFPAWDLKIKGSLATGRLIIMHKHLVLNSDGMMYLRLQWQKHKHYSCPMDSSVWCDGPTAGWDARTAIRMTDVLRVLLKTDIIGRDQLVHSGLTFVMPSVAVMVCV